MKSSKSSTVLVAVAWITILAITLPKIILQEIFHFPVSENLQYQIAFPVLLAGLVLVFVVKTLRPLRLFFGLFLVLVGAQWLVYTRLDQLPIYQRWLQDPSFHIYMLAEQSLHLVVTLAIIVFLWIVKKNFTAFFLAKGDVSAPVEPVRWLGVKAGEKWGKFGWILAICISLGTLAFLVIAGRPPMAVCSESPAIPAGGAAGCRLECIQRGIDLQGIIPLGAGGCGWQAAGASVGGGILWSLAFLWRPIWHCGGDSGCIFGVDFGKVDAGNTRAFLGVVHPLFTGRADFCLPGDWVHHPGWVVGPFWRSPRQRPVKTLIAECSRIQGSDILI